jgi:hypothetical protein
VVMRYLRRHLPQMWTLPSSPIQGASMFGDQIVKIISHLALVRTIVSDRF